MTSPAPTAPPSSLPRARTLRWSRRALSLVVLVLLVAGVATQRTYVTLPEDIVWAELSYPVAVGEYVARHEPELRQHLLRLGTDATLDLGPAYGRRTVQPEIRGAELALTLLNALLFWAVAALALAPRRGRPGIGDLHACLLLTALAVAISGPPAPRGGLGFVLPSLYLAALSLIPPLFVRFSLAFPRRMPALADHPLLARAIVLPAGAIAAWNVAAQLTWFQTPSAGHFDALTLPTRLLDVQLVVGMVAGIVLLYRNGRGAQLAREKRQAKWILWGIAIGATPFVFLRILPRVLFQAPDIVDPAVDRAVELTIPLAIMAAVVRERFLDIDVIIRRSLIYTALALGAAGAIFLTILLAGRWGRLPDMQVWVLAGALPAAAFLPARTLVSRWVDRTFFRIRHGHERALHVLARSMAPATGQGDVADALATFLAETLEPQGLGVVIRGPEDWEASGTLDAGVLRAAPTRLRPMRPESGRLLARRNATAQPEIETDDIDLGPGGEGIDLVQPVARDGRLLGLLLLARKRSERRYVEEDLQLLRASAAQAAEVLERLALVQRVAEESLARRNLAELARQKADFFARVAHDLRTPLTAIRWSVRNLSEGLAGPVSERQAEYLDSVSAASGQLTRLVDNLVDLGRLDLGAPTAPSEAVDLAAVIHDAVRALRPLAEAAGTRFEITVAPDLPAVRGRPEAAHQIVINLLDNAIKYAARDTPVEIQAERAEPGHVELTIRDHGPGLGVADRERIFHLFERGADGPRGPTKGFGIGLHVVRAWATAFGGTVRADNHPAGGARFTCRLPAETPRGEPA